MGAEYCSSFYFVITTMTTVGYGDMPIGTSTEQLFCICLMMSGVFIFSLVSGSLASILASFDQTNADLAAKVLFLNRVASDLRRSGHLGCSENCIFHDRIYPECFFHSFIHNKKGKIEKNKKNEILAWGVAP